MLPVTVKGNTVYAVDTEKKTEYAVGEVVPSELSEDKLEIICVCGSRHREGSPLERPWLGEFPNTMDIMSYVLYEYGHLTRKAGYGPGEPIHWRGKK